MSARRHTEQARAYFAAHAIRDEIADVVFRPNSVGFEIPYHDGVGAEMFHRVRNFSTGKTKQPAGQPLDLWTPAGTDGTLLVTEGESDGAAALSALFDPDDVGADFRRRQDLPPPLADLVPVALPGAGVCHGRVADLVEETSARAVIVFDGDEAGRAGAAKLKKKIPAASLIDLPDGMDLADVLAAADDPVEALANLVAEAAAGEEVHVEDDPGGQIEPLFPEMITGLLDQVLDFLGRYVVLGGDDERNALALFVAHSYAIEAAHATPYMLVVSPEKRSGKSRLLQVLELLVFRPWGVIGASEAAMFRKIAKDRPTLLLDEIDAIFGSHTERTEPLRAILNAGNRPGATVARCVGESKDVEDFPIFCAKVLAGIDTGQKIPDTVRDRSVTINMVRKTGSEPVERLRHRIADAQAEPLRIELEGWAAGSATDLLEAADPDLPHELDDRAAEAWEPLLAIADLAGGNWPDRARTAAMSLSGEVDRDEVTTGTMLLGAIRTVFGDDDRITTVSLLDRINADDELPFGGWGDGKGIDGRRLAKLLKPYKVKPRPIRIDDDVSKGYLRRQFEEAWERWLAHPAGSVTSVTSVTDDEGVTPDSALEAGCNPVTVVTAKSDGGDGVTDLCAEAEQIAARFDMEV